ncbi:LCP family protein [Streptomyces clavuligerus]|uniref:Membrane protein n=1 Tax=Streptomyces clavuligerus TaxID=1901 RepID=B5H383_STRCL|nr:LCP family protein [Streptomyces clavuligerus]ANW20249.1 hypothetical protein BB341_19535 [Streptomyces clavuligerus]AXU14873.1 LytR family transcriptional regulator [Streptomyces clavuligerus]EDY53029.1 membrane protein [Streptomyces clavuligerus]EFG06823.1 Membrane protein [Streptomyces clavuligerus]MBY6304912.1 LCP family protein [Streptomyces clavuligerus]
MNDQQNPYDPYYPQPRLIGYDEYGQPVYEQPPQYDPYAYQSYEQGGSFPPQPQPQPAVPYEQPYPHPPSPFPQYPEGTGGAPAPAPAPQVFTVPDQRGPSADGGEYRTGQFSFIEEQDETSEDVIDWLKFTESRSERREEARRRGRNRVIALVAVVVLLLAGGAGYLWYSGGLPGGSEDSPAGTAAAGPQKRDLIVVHLHNTKKKGTSTALLVANSTTRQGATVLLPNALSVTRDDGTGTTLGASVDEDGSDGTREAVGALLGAEITGTWRLDTPFLENLVELVGGVDLTTDTAVPAPKGGDPLVRKGENQTLNGRAAVAYATHRGTGEAETAQLQRFGQIMQAVLRKLPSDAKSATVTVETLGQILDPSLTESALGASLATLSEYAKGGDYRTELLPVQQDGGLTADAVDAVVKDVLGGSVATPDKDAALRVEIRNATGQPSVSERARVLLVNGGYSVTDSKTADPAATSEVSYGEEARRADAVEVAKTLGLPESAVRQTDRAAGSAVAVVLGQDFPTG